MSTWFYYDNSGQKQGPITDGQLKELAMRGTITAQTVIETESGKSAPAGKIKGLTFRGTTPPRATPPAESPFVAPLPNAHRGAQPEPQSLHTPIAKNSTGSIWVTLIGIVLISSVCFAAWSILGGSRDEQMVRAPGENPQPAPGQPPVVATLPKDEATALAMIIPPNDNGIYYFNSTSVNVDWVYVDSNNIAKQREYPGPDVRIMDNVRSVYCVTPQAYFFITTNNELWAMGSNYCGYIGDNTGLDKSEPVLVMKDVANLYFEQTNPHACAVYALKTDKSQWGWGRLTKDDDTTTYAPIKIEDTFNYNQQLLVDHISTRNGNLEIYPMIDLSNDIVGKLGGENNIVTSIEIRGRHYAVTKDGVLWGWGRNEGALGDGTRATRDEPVKIAENVKRLLPDHFITHSNDWYQYSSYTGSYRPEIVQRNVLFNRQSGGWYMPDGKLYMGSVHGTRSDQKLPSIVRASDGKVIVPRPEQIVLRDISQ